MSESRIVWSYSGAKVFETCPRQYNEVKRLGKHPPQDTTATLYGKSVHKALEDYIVDAAPIPPQFSRFKRYADMVLDIKGDRYIEYKMGFTEDLKPCEFDGENVWWHGIPDVLIVNGKTAYILDWKTSKSARFADTGQLELLSVAAMLHHPEIQTVKGSLLFLVANDMVVADYKREDIPKIMSKWYGKINQIHAAIESDVWNPKSSPLCKFCPVDWCNYR